MPSETMTIYVNNEPLDVVAVYRQRGWASLPPTPTLTGYQIKAFAPSPWNPDYQLGREEDDRSITIIRDGQAVPLSDGLRFIGIPSGTIGGMHG